jgi:hypothetical protein
MKKLFTILFCCLVLFGCKKNIFDYRSKFLGNYNFSVHESAWTIYGQTLDTSYSYNGTISYGKSGDKSLTINYSEKASTEAILYEDGSIKFSYLSGEFESTKKIRFKAEYQGLGGGTASYVTGEKTK